MTYSKRPSKPFTGKTKAFIGRGDVSGWLKIIVPWIPGKTPDFVDELKSTIQPSHRSWNPDTKAWAVNEIFLEELIPMLQRYFDEIETDLTTEPTAPENLFKPIFEALKGLPNGNLDKVYKQLAVAVHPDHGGSDELMTKLNQAYQESK